MTPLARAVLIAFVVLAGLWDLRQRRIPNWLTIPALVAALALRPYTESLPGLGLALLIGIPLFALRALGAGDVKLMAASAAFLGPKPFVYAFLINAVLGGLAALAVAITKGRLLRTLANVGSILSQLGRLRPPDHTLDSPTALTIPRGAIFAVAVLIVIAAA